MLSSFTVRLQSVLAFGFALAAFAALTVVAAPSADAATATQRSKALSVAAAQRGDWYLYGAAGPSRFDCSGLLYYSFRQVGVTIPRTSEGQRTGLRAVSKSYKRAGDIIVFVNSYGRAYHVGVYAGNGYIWHSSKPGTQVSKAKIWTSRYVVRRA